VPLTTYCVDARTVFRGLRDFRVLRVDVFAELKVLS
jgi:hypothetical protein